MPGYRAVVTSTAEHPLLFLDFDGPLIPFGSSSGHSRAAAAAAVRAADQGNPLLARLDPGIGARLMALGCHLVRATTWLEEAAVTCAALLLAPGHHRPPSACQPWMSDRPGILRP